MSITSQHRPYKSSFVGNVQWHISDGATKMPNIGAIVGAGLGLFIVGTMFCVPIGKEPYEEIENRYEPIKSEVSFIRQQQVRRWYYFDEATEVQYIVKNNDTVDGDFTLNYIFNNDEKDTKSITRKIKILAGTREAVSEVSPLNGVSVGNLAVSSYKLVSHVVTKTRDVYIWSHLGDLTQLFRFK